MSRKVIEDPRGLAAWATDPITRALARLTVLVTEAPWTMSADELTQARAAGLGDGAILQAIALAAMFGHLNRIADAIGIELDYDVALEPSHAEPATRLYPIPAQAEWPDPDGTGPLELASRPQAREALAAWRNHALDREAPLPRGARAVIAREVAALLGDAATVRALDNAGSVGPLDEPLREFAAVVTLAPWRLGDATLVPLRAAGLADDTSLFDAIATATACTTFSRLATALAALRRQPPV